MPKNPAINFESFMKGLNPFASQTMSDAHLIHFKQARLAEVIREFPGVKGAQVFIDPTSNRQMLVVVDPATGERRYDAEG